MSVQEGANADADEDEKFTQEMDLGGGLTKHTRDGEMGVQEIAMVMTDIEAPKEVKFAEWENADGDTPQVLDVMKDDGQGAGQDETANALDITQGADDVANLMFVRATTDGMLNFSRDNPGTEPTMDVDEGFARRHL